MNTAFFLVDQVFKLYATILLLRMWLQIAGVDFYHPFCQFIVKVTHPIIGPLRRIIPSIGKIDTASLLVAFLLITAINPVVLMIKGITPQFWIQYLIIGVFNTLFVFGRMIFWMVILQAVLSWVSRGDSPISYFVYQLTAPFMLPIRRILPPIGMIDFSGMVVIFGLYLLSNVAIDIQNYLLQLVG